MHRDLVGADALAALLSRTGIDRTTHVVLYGDDDWYASWAPWQLKAHGLMDVILLDGGRGYWQAQVLPYETSAPSISPTTSTSGADRDVGRDCPGSEPNDHRATLSTSDTSRAETSSTSTSRPSARQA